MACDAREDEAHGMPHEPGDYAGAYGRGYAAGKEKAHFDVRHILDDGHANDCGCEPCKTVRIVARQLLVLVRWLE